MPEWKTYKGQNPWALEKQGNKFGYVNNPNFRSPATVTHNPCGYWYSSRSGVRAGEALPKRSWVSSAISADGKYMTAVCRDGEIHSSDDYGMTWDVQVFGYDFYSVFMNSTGQYRIVGSLNPSKTLISNDFGITWTDIGIAYCVKATLSEDGMYQTIALGGASVYRSSNYGATWVKATGLYASVLAMSSSGRYQLTGYGGASSWKSNDYGATWSVAQGWNVWNPAMSKDGKYQLLGAAYSWSNSFKSSDYGATWQAITLPGILYPYASGCCVSSTGQHMALINAEGGNDYIYVSNNYGVTWAKRSDASLANWSMLTMSEDGQYLSAIQYTSGIGATQVIYVSNDFGVTWDISGSASKDWKHISNSSFSQHQIAAVDGTDFLYVSSDFGIYWANYFTQAYVTDFASYGTKVVWHVDGVAVPMAVLEVGAGKEYTTFGDACAKASGITGAVLLLVYPGSYASGGTITGSNRTVYVRGMGASPLDVEFLNCCPQVSGTGCNLFLENIYIHYETGAGFTSLQFSASMNDLTLNKVYISDPNVSVEYTPFLAGLTWAGSLNASNCTIAATWNWELVFFQFDPSRITFNKVSYVGGYWGESSCAVQFATYNPAVEDCGAMYGSFRITEETEIETLSLTPLWALNKWQTFDKDIHPWELVKQGNKFGYINNPRWRSPATQEHNPCGYWYGDTVIEVPGETPPPGTYRYIQVSESGQYIVICGWWRTNIRSEDYGRTWQVILGSIKFHSNLFMSPSGKYCYAQATDLKELHVSTDYGFSFSKKMDIVSAAQAAFSKDEAFQIYGHSSAAYFSDDYGQTEKEVKIGASRGLQIGPALSDTGKYGFFQLYSGLEKYAGSLDYGVTWGNCGIPTVISGAQQAGIQMSSSGKYLLTGTYQHYGNLYRSSNYGSTWGRANLTDYNYLGNYVYSCRMSRSGQFQVAACYNYNLGMRIQTSNDFGVTWRITDTDHPTARWDTMIMSDSGQYILLAHSTIAGLIYASHDYGETWFATSAPSKVWWGMDADSSGRYVTAAPTDGGIYFSSDYGLTWSTNQKYYLNTTVQNSGLVHPVWPMPA